MNVKEVVNQIEVSVNKEVAEELKKTISNIGQELTAKVNQLKGEIFTNDEFGINKMARDKQVELLMKHGQSVIDGIKNKVAQLEGNSTAPVANKVDTGNVVEKQEQQEQPVEEQVQQPQQETTEDAKQQEQASQPNEQEKPKLDASKLFGAG